MRERTPGTWELVVSAGLDPVTGRYRRVIRTIKGTSKREVKAALSELEVAVAAGKVSLDDMTFADLLERWMEHIAGLGRADTTPYHYRRYIDREIRPVLGAIRQSKLKALRHRPVVHEAAQAGVGACNDPPSSCDPALLAEPSGAVGARAAKRRQARVRPVTAAARAVPA